MNKIKQIASWITVNSKYVLMLLVAGVAFYAGFFVCQNYNKNVVEVPVEIEKTIEKPVPIEVPVEVKGDTVIRYVEKESVLDADVEIANPAPVVSVAYNGEKTELAGNVSEKQKFENGKLQVEQKTETVLDVTPIVEREVNTAVTKAVQENTDKLNTEHQAELKQEKHKRHKREIETYLAGLGTAGLLLLF